MSGNARIPKTIAEFNGYLLNTNTYLQGTILNDDPAIINPVTYLRLGLVKQNADDWTLKRDFWNNTLYPKYLDEAQSTKAVKAQVQKFMKDFRTFAQPLINIMASSPNAVGQDAATFHFVLERKKAEQRHSGIETECVVSMDNIKGGGFKVGCRTSTDTKRASKPDGADSVQVAYQITASQTAPAAIPSNDETDGFARKIFTTASFTFQVGAPNKGKWIHCYFRWYNTKHADLSGNWGDLHSEIIS